jgi:phospholipase C
MALDPVLRERIQHIVVVMMENRSFDHMLGYLGKSRWRLGDPNDPNSLVEGLKDEEDKVTWDGHEYATFPLGTTKWEPPSHQDPPHSGKMVGWQVEDRSRYVWAYRQKHEAEHGDDIDPRDVLGYLTADEVPIYDFLAREFCVCDHWFCSVAGATWPNRMFAVAGTAGGETDIPETMLEGLWGKHTFFRELDKKDVSWRWYSSDPSLLRAFDGEYRTDKTDHDHFAYFNEFSKRQPNNFLKDARQGTLPSVSWVDPNFFKFPLGLDGPAEANDDHPPHDVILGQKFIHVVYETLRRSPQWERSLLIVTYDEHGGFYDHVKPKRPLGPRVPTFLISPWVARGRPLKKELEHTSIIKTVLRRFADDRAIEVMGPRVYYADDVWDAITEPSARPCPPVANPGAAAIEVTKDLKETELPFPGSTLQRVIEVIDKHSREGKRTRADLVDLQEDLILVYEEMRRVVPRGIGRTFSRIARALPNFLTRIGRRVVDPFLGDRKIPDRRP